MNNMILRLMAWKKAQEGQSLVEYGLILGLIVVAVVAVLLTLGPKIAAMFTSVETQITPAS